METPACLSPTLQSHYFLQSGMDSSFITESLSPTQTIQWTQLSCALLYSVMAENRLMTVWPRKNMKMGPFAYYHLLTSPPPLVLWFISPITLCCGNVSLSCRKWSWPFCLRQKEKDWKRKQEHSGDWGRPNKILYKYKACCGCHHRLPFWTKITVGTQRERLNTEEHDLAAQV